MVLATLSDTNMTNSFGGLEVRNSNQININLFCGLCNRLLLNPVQLRCCDTRLCSWCSKKGVPESEPFVCPFCNIKQSQKQACNDCGAMRELNMITIGCYLCSWVGTYQDYQEHLQENHANFECDDCHTRFLAINQYEEHRQELCERLFISCSLNGCNERVERSAMSAHYLSVEHQTVLCRIISTFHAPKTSTSGNPSHSRTSSNVVHDVDAASVGAQETGNSGSFISEDSANNYPQLRLFDESNSVTFPFYKTQDKMNMVFSIDSPKFKTSPHGYIFSYRVCSTWDSSNPNQGYLSIYLTLLQSDFDPILFYPFPYDISILLLDQSGQKKHMISTIKPNEHPLAFSRPTSERNAEVGIMKFCPLNYLTDPQSIYLQDGVFFIRVFIDFRHIR